MKKLFSTFILSLVVMLSFGASPQWTIDRSDFANSMTITGRVIMNGNYTADVSDSIAVFVGSELRGVANLSYVSQLDEYFVFLLVSSNFSNGETLTFKYYDASSDFVSTLINTTEFIVDESLGMVSSPYIFMDVDGGNDILSYDFPGKSTNSIIDISAKTVKVAIADSYDLSALVASFTLSTGASALVSTMQQESVETINDFSDTVKYVVTSSGGIEAIWSIVLADPVGISEFQKMDAILFPNPCTTALTIQFDNLMQGTQLHVYSISGSLVLSESVLSNRITINTAQFPKGIYTIVVKSDTHIFTKRVTKI